MPRKVTLQLHQYHELTDAAKANAAVATRAVLATDLLRAQQKHVQAVLALYGIPQVVHKTCGPSYRHGCHAEEAIRDQAAIDRMVQDAAAMADTLPDEDRRQRNMNLTADTCRKIVDAWEIVRLHGPFVLRFPQTKIYNVHPELTPLDPLASIGNDWQLRTMSHGVVGLAYRTLVGGLADFVWWELVCRSNEAGSRTWVDTWTTATLAERDWWFLKDGSYRYTPQEALCPAK